MWVKPETSEKTTVSSLVFRVGTRRWFWGWGTPQPVENSGQQRRAPIEQPAGGRWSNVAEWLRRMHAEADRPTTSEE